MFINKLRFRNTVEFEESSNLNALVFNHIFLHSILFLLLKLRYYEFLLIQVYSSCCTISNYCEIIINTYLKICTEIAIINNRQTQELSDIFSIFLKSMLANFVLGL